jgi:hypothetical protein
MKLRSLVLACCALLSAQSLRSQTPASDPISGTWTGDIGLDLTTRHQVRFDLKLTGASTITGTVTGPGAADFKGGTFDPKTGALKLEVDVKEDGGATRFVFEGTAVGGTATGRVNDGRQIGSFRLMRGAAAPAGAPPGGSDAAPELRRSFVEVSGFVSKAAALVPADKYGYRPAPSVRTFGQLVGHIADSYKYYCDRALGRDTQWSGAIEKGNTDKATLALKLKQSLDSCDPAYAGAGKVGALIDNVGHTNLHYGNIITYLRMLGLTPPSS